jgi:hypothetical protein
MAEEKVHGRVQLRTELNQWGHAQVGEECDSINEKEEQEEEDSQLRVIW